MTWSAWKTRPVLDLPIDWSDGVGLSRIYEMGRRKIGFGAEVAEPQQQYLVHSWNADFALRSPWEIDYVWRFFQVLLGRQAGSWLPGPRIDMEITGAVSSSQFDMAGQTASDDWTADPCRELVLEDPDGTLYFTKITAIERGAGFDRVSISPGVAKVGIGWIARRNYYVRLDGDEIALDFSGEGYAQWRARLRELPRNTRRRNWGVGR